MIGTIALARRIEAAESRLSLAMAAGSKAAGTPDVFGMKVNGGAAVFCGNGAPMTKVIGVGIQAPLADRDLDTIECAFHAVGCLPGWEVSTLADFESIRRLERRGYRLQRIEMVLGCGLAAVTLPALPDGITVTTGEADLWGRIAVDAFSAAETVEGRDAPAESYDRAAMEEAMAQYRHDTAIRRYLARLHDVPAGSASARVDDGVFQMCGAGTLVEYRRRGVQNALLTARLADARAAGCDVAIVTVEPGSRSQANAQRRGFSPLYSRLVLAREA
jgi:ribosomal protein S18 acetylase RimI-like enzyme